MYKGLLLMEYSTSLLGLLYVVWGFGGDIIGTQVPLPGDTQSAEEAQLLARVGQGEPGRGVGGHHRTKGIAPHEFRE